MLETWKKAYHAMTEVVKATGRISDMQDIRNEMAPTNIPVQVVNFPPTPPSHTKLERVQGLCLQGHRLRDYCGFDPQQVSGQIVHDVQHSLNAPADPSSHATAYFGPDGQPLGFQTEVSYKYPTDPTLPQLVQSLCCHTAPGAAEMSFQDLSNAYADINQMGFPGQALLFLANALTPSQE